MPKKSIRDQVESLKRKKIAAKKVVSLADFRSAKPATDAQTILVVDDDEIIRTALKRILEGEAFEVIMAKDGIELSKVLESSQLDLILLDINLPWVDGYELCRLIRSHGSLKSVPIVFISGRSDEQDVQKAFEAGANDFVAKPFEIDDILSTLNKHLMDESG